MKFCGKCQRHFSRSLCSLSYDIYPFPSEFCIRQRVFKLLGRTTANMAAYILARKRLWVYYKREHGTINNPTILCAEADRRHSEVIETCCPMASCVCPACLLLLLMLTMTRTMT